MLPTDQEVEEAKSKPASEMPWLDEGPYISLDNLEWLPSPVVEARMTIEGAQQFIRRCLAEPKHASPCRERD